MIEALLNKIEGYGFQCEAGPLTLCQDWMKLRVHLLIAKDAALSQAEIAQLPTRPALPPLTDAMYHAVRGLEFATTDSQGYEVAPFCLCDDDTERIWDAINTALRIQSLPLVSVPISGFTTIPVGTLVFHDHGVYRWPANGNGDDTDPQTEFEVSVKGNTVTLTAPGFGLQPNYRNGSLLVKLVHWQEAWGPRESERDPSIRLRGTLGRLCYEAFDEHFSEMKTGQQVKAWEREPSEIKETYRTLADRILSKLPELSRSPEPAGLRSEPALQHFQEMEAECEDLKNETPVERLRYFCSLALKGQDWLDVEEFFDAILAAPLPEGPAVDATDARDAERYRWLRQQDWFDGELCVLRDPKKVLTNGVGLGSDCPSRERLDDAIDAARKVVAASQAGMGEA